MELLKLRLQFQSFVAQILVRGPLANANNPKGYVATAAFNQMQRSKLINKIELSFKLQKAGRCLGEDHAFPRRLS